MYSHKSLESHIGVQHLGGIHSGCATSGVCWLILKIVNVYRNRQVEHPSILVVGLLTNLAVFITAVAAIPWVRNTHHKSVEAFSTHGILHTNPVCLANAVSSSVTIVSSDGPDCSLPVSHPGDDFVKICH